LRSHRFASASGRTTIAALTLTILASTESGDCSDSVAALQNLADLPATSFVAKCLGLR